MATPIEYQKLMTEIVYINLPGPEEPAPNMTGGELLHGFLAELHRQPRIPRAHHLPVQQVEHPLPRPEKIESKSYINNKETTRRKSPAIKPGQRRTK
jgi:hypothetical protein